MSLHSPLCRFCQAALTETFVDLGMSPLSNAYIRPDQLSQGERFYPLHAFVCSACWLVQLEEFESPEAIFSDYAYFSSYSDSWLVQCEKYAHEISQKLGLNTHSQVIEVASNDGYLLQYFAQAGIPVLGIEPAANVAEVARSKGIPTEVVFVGAETIPPLLNNHAQADLLIGNNVLAHVPDICSFVAGLALLLKAEGVLTMEFPHLLQLIAQRQFDTIYHEHFSYLSLLAVEKIFAAAGLTLFDVESLPSHGGSLRIYAQHSKSGKQPHSGRLEKLRILEQQAGLDQIATYQNFALEVRKLKYSLLNTLIELKQAGKTLVGYGAPAKGNTLLNYCGIRSDFLDYTVDRSPHKQGLSLPGVHIPILAPEAIFASQPDYVLILPWNLKDEIMQQMADIRTWGGKFILPIPEVQIL
jgi:hypothetical protein